MWEILIAAEAAEKAAEVAFPRQDPQRHYTHRNGVAIEFYSMSEDTTSATPSQIVCGYTLK